MGHLCIMAMRFVEETASSGQDGIMTVSKVLQVETGPHCAPNPHKDRPRTGRNGYPRGERRWVGKPI